MKNKLAIIFIILLFVLSGCGTKNVVKSVLQDNSFSDIGNLTLGRYGHALVTLNNDIYIIGGIEKSSSPISTAIEKFNVETKSSEKLPTSILGRRYLGAVLVDSNIYIVGGEKEPGDIPFNTAIYIQTTGIIEKYDLSSNKVVELSEMPNPRKGMGIVEHDGKIYVIGGSQYRSLTKDKYGYKPKISTEIPIQRNEDLPKDFSYLSSMDIYDIKTDTWTEGPSMHKARECKATLYKNKIYVIGGYNGKALDNVEVFNIEKGIWEEHEDAPVSISAYSCVEKNGLIYFFGDYEELNIVMIYNPETNEWFKIESNFKGCRHNASIVCVDDIYIAGGNITPRLNTTVNIIQKYKGI